MKHGSSCYFRSDDSDTSDEETSTLRFRSLDTSQTVSERSSTDLVKPYRFWYSIEVRASPAMPVKVLDVSCAVFSAVGIEITVSNPSDEEVVMNVIIEGDGLHGDTTLVLGPKQQTVYQAKYTPIAIGRELGR